MRTLIAAAAVAALLAPASALAQQHQPVPPEQAVGTVLGEKVSRYVPKPAGTQEKLRLWYGPYTVPPGHDMQRFDLELPVRSGYVLSIEPGMRSMLDLTTPDHLTAHIHHAHWLALDPGNEEDNHTYGFTKWMFGNGDEETKGDSTERTAAEPEGPIYGGYVPPTQPQTLIFMIHNKTSQPLGVYIVLDVTFVHGTKAELQAKGGRPYHDLTGVIFGRTYDVPRRREGDGTFVTSRDAKPIEWTSTMDGTIIGMGGHLHPGGLRVHIANMGAKADPCPDDGRGYGGTQLLRADALTREGVPLSEDFQMEVTHPAWRAPIRKGDRLRITGLYANREHAWYYAMTHAGLYVDQAQPPKGRCRPYLVGGREERRTVVKRRKHVHYRISMAARLVRKVHWHKRRVTSGIETTDGVPNREWGHHPNRVCGVAGAPPCDRPEPQRPPGRLTDTVTISNFLYLPGDRSLGGQDGAPPRVKRGTSLRFVNGDQPAGIRHSVTTCAWPCNGPYVSNYPHADGRWDSDTLGYDPIDGGAANPVAQTPKDLPVGRYSYFCRIHPWMRGAFEVVA